MYGLEAVAVHHIVMVVRIGIFAFFRNEATAVLAAVNGIVQCKGDSLLRAYLHDSGVVQPQLIAVHRIFYETGRIRQIPAFVRSQEFRHLYSLDDK